jgi:peptide-methionine (R)-S-oxide reductase
MEKINKTEKEWKKILTKEQFRLLREKGTERAFTEGNFYYEKRNGKFYCVACGNLLFDSEDKFDSGTGWPSFVRADNPGSIEFGEELVGQWKEVHCAKCDGHLGHVFNDGPIERGGKRFCINGGSLKFFED